MRVAEISGWLAGATATQRTVASAVLVLALLAVVLLARRLRRVRISSVATLALVGIVTGTTVDGAIRFAERGLHTSGLETLFPAVVFEALAVSTYSRARAYARVHGHPGPWAGRLYLLGAVAGAIVATAGDSIGAIGFRAVMPILAVRLLVWDLTPDGHTRTATGAVTWRWTPRRLGILLGAITPGDEDLDEVHRGHAVRRMATCRHRIDCGGLLPRRWYRARLRRLALRVDDDVIDQVRARVTRAALVETLTAPSGEPICEPPVDPVESFGEPSREPLSEPPSKPAHEPGRRVRSLSLTAAQRVIAAHRRYPDAPHQRIADLAGVSVATVKRHRPGGSPTRRPAAQTPGPAEPAKRLNGDPVPALVDADR